MQAAIFNLLEYTSRSVFLTGKAGTGKTTFLSHFTAHTKKNFVIAAPTGIAAINAGGVTIHSLFGLPLSTFVPTLDEVDRNTAINIPQLLPHFKFRQEKLKIFRALEILIIDEVSMLRADVLDMIDFALRSARKSTQKFGGVQLLLIGDLYQLPPVVKDSSENILFQYYKTPFFFSATALENIHLLTVELKKVYRQQDGVFLDILNAIRTNQVQPEQLQILHSRYQPAFEATDGYIYLVSHNYIADAINKKELAALKGKTHKFEAVVSGDFKESQYPNDKLLELKKGAQVMFIRNDSSGEKNFFNGMLATITDFTEGGLKVLPQGQKETLEVYKETWEHKKYYSDDEQKIKEDIIGKYEQLPLRLAWAVTIHKSQGLTFDKVVIDAGRSFTSGQVYVALSRCRTLEGIVLKSIITPSVIHTDERVIRFQQRTSAGDEFATILEAEKYDYALQKLIGHLDFNHLISACEEWMEMAANSRFANSESTSTLSGKIHSHLQALHTVLEKFIKYLTGIRRTPNAVSEQWGEVQRKCSGAVHYFYQQVSTVIFEPLQEFYTACKGIKGTKMLTAATKDFLDITQQYLHNLQKVQLLEAPLFTLETTPPQTVSEKKPSHMYTYEMFEAGQQPEAIATARNMAQSTILGHLAKFASLGILDINRLFSTEQILFFEKKYREHLFENSTAAKPHIGDVLGYDEIRILLNHFKYLSKKNS